MNLKIAGLSTVLLLCTGLIVWVGSCPTVDAPSMPAKPAKLSDIVPQETEAEVRAERDVFSKAEVEPSIKEAYWLTGTAQNRTTANTTNAETTEKRLQ